MVISPALKWMLMTVSVYVFLWFFLSRLIIPNLGFRKSTLPKKLPAGMEVAIKALKKKSNSKKQFLYNAYFYLTKRYHGDKRMTYPKFHYLFYSLEKIWNTPGFMHCNQQNHLLRIFLVRSGFFKDDEIKLVHTIYVLNMHQYMKIKLDGKWIYVDPWFFFVGLRIGEHAGL